MHAKIVEMRFLNTIFTTLCLVMSKHTFVGCQWAYSGTNGPKFWGNIYPTCSNERQSPIEINDDVAEMEETLTPFIFYGFDDIRTMENLTIWNDGYTVTVRVHGNLSIAGGDLDGLYSLQHFHFHWGATDRFGSEHWLNGVSYPLEMHLVHKSTRHSKMSNALNDPTGLAVLGILAKIGKPHPFFQAIIDNLRLLDIGDYATSRSFPLRGLLPDDVHTYYRYNGSLTTPPCSESVVWTIFREAIEISEHQIQQVRAISAISNITDNFRPLQRLNGRRISVTKKSSSDTTNDALKIESIESDSVKPWSPKGQSCVQMISIVTVNLYSMFVVIQTVL